MYVCLIALVAHVVVFTLDFLVHNQCVDEASLCQAVENFSLALTCSPCNDTLTVDWFFSPVYQKEDQLSQHNKTLFLAAVNVTKEKASGCYMCQCGSGEVKNEMHFSVQVGLPGTIH